MSDPTRPAPSPTFCVIPWVHAFGDERGLLRPCCMTLGSDVRDLQAVDAEGRPYTVHDAGSLEAGWNSPFMKTLRREMLDGTRPSVCRRCFEEEDLGIKSYREDSNEMFGAHIEAALAATSPDGTAPIDLVCSADFRLGNACNLKCRMCSPVSTKLLIPEWQRLFNVPDGHAELEALRKVDWFDADDFWNNCERLMPGLERLHFAGGEPMIISRMLDFLQRVVDEGHAHHIQLSYVTNLTTLPERVTKLWPAFQGVSLTGSLDGHEPVNSFIRYPARWDRIDTHLRRLVVERDAFNCSKITINTTVQAYNVLTLADLFEYLLPLHAPHFTVYPRLSKLDWPSCFSIQVLPPALKALAAERLRAFVARWDGRWPDTSDELPRFLKAIEGVIEHMEAADRTAELPEFARRTLVFDEMRGQNVREALPDLAPAFDLPAGAAAP